MRNGVLGYNESRLDRLRERVCALALDAPYGWDSSAAKGVPGGGSQVAIM
jgi:hypothetical protein